MSILPVARITSGVHQIGRFNGTPAAVVKVLADSKSSWVTQCAAAARVFHDIEDYPIVAYPQNEKPMTELLKQRNGREDYTLVGEPTLAGLLKSMRPSHVVFTGPEPCDYDMTALFKELQAAGRQIHLETRGATHNEPPASVWVTLRTAPARDGLMDVDVRMVARANEIVAKIYSSEDIDGVDRMQSIAKVKPDVVTWIIPARQDQRLYSMCVDVAASKRWRVARPAR